MGLKRGDTSTNDVVGLEVWGDLACFTRPEMKIERFSYPVMSPAAARGILDAIYCKPAEFGWRVDRIEVLRPIRYIALRRNEVKEKVSVSLVRHAMKTGGEMPVIVADATKEMTGTDTRGRTQRQTMALAQVHYRIHAHVCARQGFAAKVSGFVEQMRRRIDAGKCFYQPYLGCREFPAFFGPVQADASPPQPIDLDLGFMVYDVFDLNEVKTDGYAKAKISIFHARIDHGVLSVPPFESDAVRKVE